MDPTLPTLRVGAASPLSRPQTSDHHGKAPGGHNDGRPGQLSGLGPPGVLKRPCVFCSKSVSCGAFVWARRALNIPKRWFPARAAMVLVADVPPHSGGFHVWPGAPNRLYHFWETSQGNGMASHRRRNHFSVTEVPPFCFIWRNTNEIYRVEVRVTLAPMARHDGGAEGAVQRGAGRHPADGADG
jgi:hypothetical protein